MDPRQSACDIRYDSARLQVAVERWVSGSGRETVEIERACIHHPGAVVVAAVQDEALVLVRQFRYPVRDWLWEVPAGTMVPGEDPLVCAQRELAEETGFRAGSWTEQCRFLPAPGISDENMVLYMASELMPGTTSPDPGELVQAELMSRTRITELCRSGEIRDGKTLIALALLGWWPVAEGVSA